MGVNKNWIIYHLKEGNFWREVKNGMKINFLKIHTTTRKFLEIIYIDHTHHIILFWKLNFKCKNYLKKFILFQKFHVHNFVLCTDELGTSYKGILLKDKKKKLVCTFF